MVLVALAPAQSPFYYHSTVVPRVVPQELSSRSARAIDLRDFVKFGDFCRNLELFIVFLIISFKFHRKRRKTKKNDEKQRKTKKTKQNDEKQRKTKKNVCKPFREADFKKKRL